MPKFRDKIRTVDYVIVISRVSAMKHSKLITVYINNLIKNGLDVEQSMGITEPVIFLKLHMPLDTYQYCQRRYPRWEKVLNAKYEYPNPKSMFKFLRTPLDYIDPYEGDNDETGIIYYTSKMLIDCKFGKRLHQHGIALLMTMGVVLKAYPLHKGPVMDFNTPIEEMNDRTRLAKYWTSFRNIHKTQPLDLVKKYFGIQVGIFFAFKEFYVKMLLIPVVLSIVTNLLSFLHLMIRDRQGHTEGFCRNEDRFLCGYCLEDEMCHLHHIQDTCAFAELSLMFDTFYNLFYALFMSAWTGCVSIFWRRRLESLTTRWNLKGGGLYLVERFQFRENVKYWRKSRFHGKLEYYLIRSSKVMRAIWISLMFMLLQIIFLILLFFNINCIVYIHVIFTIHTGVFNVVWFDILLMIAQTIFTILIFKMLNYLVRRMVRFLMHKYTDRHDNSFLVLRYLLAFANQYGLFLYVTLFRGQFYNIPYPTVPWPIQFDTCQPITCGVNNFIVITLRCCWFVVEAIIELITPKLKKKKKKDLTGKIPQYEIEYKLTERPRYQLHMQFTRIMIMHGFIACFAISNSLGPIITLIMLLIRIRLDAYNYIYNNQRIVPKLIFETDTWHMILMFITYISVLINSMGIVSVSEGVDRENHFKKYGTYEGYFNSTLAAFALKDMYHGAVPEDQICYYRARRYPAGHEHEYKYSGHYFEMLDISLIFMAVFMWIVISFFHMMAMIPKNVKCEIGQLRRRRRKIKAED